MFHEWMIYRYQKKIAKRELVKAMATALPLFNECVKQKSGLVNFFLKLAKSTEATRPEELSGEIQKLLLSDRNEKKNTADEPDAIKQSMN